MLGDNQYQKAIEALRDKQSHVMSPDMIIKFIQARLASTAEVSREYFRLMEEHGLIKEVQEYKYLIMPTALDLEINDMLGGAMSEKDDWNSRRIECLRKLIKTFREIDNYNKAHSDPKMWNMEKAENEVMKYYRIEREKANRWINEAMKVNNNWVTPL